VSSRHATDTDRPTVSDGDGWPDLYVANDISDNVLFHNTGGKFEGKGYKVSGGLHGVGVSVVNALSSRLECEVDRDGKRHYIEFERGGKLNTKLAVVCDAPRGRTGTTIRFWPDPTVFEITEFRTQASEVRASMEETTAGVIRLPE